MNKHQTSRVDQRAALRLAGVGIAVFAAGSSSQTAAGAGNQPPTPTPVIPTLQTEFVLEALVMIAAAVEIGPSSGGTRRYIPITGGTFHGPNIQGVVLPGGADWQVDRPDGVTEIDALYSIKADDGAVIAVHNAG